MTDLDRLDRWARLGQFLAGALVAFVGGCLFGLLVVVVWRWWT